MALEGIVSLTVKGVPTRITREQASELIRSLGLDPNVVESLTFGPRCITAVVHALNEQGQRYLGPDGMDIARHQIAIPIIDPRAQEAARRFPPNSV